jgi:hypothetical protein
VDLGHDNEIQEEDFIYVLRYRSSVNYQIFGGYRGSVVCVTVPEGRLACFTFEDVC